MKHLAIAALLATGACAASEPANNTAAPAKNTAAPIDASAYTAPATPTPILLIGCRQGECGWEEITGLADGENLGAGVLRTVTSRSGKSVHLGDAAIPEAYGKDIVIEWKPAAESYMLCSKTRPTEISWQADEKTFLVTTFDLADPAGYQVSGTTFYMEVCHGLAPGKWTAEDLKRLGYRAPVKPGQERLATLDAVRAYLR